MVVSRCITKHDGYYAIFEQLISDKHKSNVDVNALAMAWNLGRFGINTGVNHVGRGWLMNGYPNMQPGQTNALFEAINNKEMGKILVFKIVQAFKNNIQVNNALEYAKIIKKTAIVKMLQMIVDYQTKMTKKEQSQTES